MSDIWSGIGVGISKSEGEFLYRQGGEIHGPVPRQTIVDKLLRGELPLDISIAIKGGEFNPITRVASFAEPVKQAQKLAAKRSAAKVRRVLLLVLLVLAGAGGVTAYFVKKELDRRYKEEQALIAAKIAEQQRLKDEKAKVGTPELVALVTLGAEEEVKIKGSGERRTGPVKPRRVGEKEQSSPADERAISECQRSQGEILSVLGRHLGKINVCVQDEKDRDKQGLLPPSLQIDFVVRPDGKVVEFGIGDRHYAKGPLNNCMTKVFAGVSYPSASGTNCPVSLPLKIGK